MSIIHLFVECECVENVWNIQENLIFIQREKEELPFGVSSSVSNTLQLLHY